MTYASTQKWNPAQYAENARFVSDLGMPVVNLLAPVPGERILDLGCGDGALTIKLQQLGCKVIGVDFSPEMVAAAQSLGLNAYVMDGQALQFNSEFDAVFSNAALHWMTESQAVIDRVWCALKPGGRFVGEFGGYGNVAAIVTAIEAALALRGLAAPSPWFFPRPEEYQKSLEERGFVVREISLIPRPTLLPGDVGGWIKTLAHPYTSILPESEKPGFIAGVVESLRPKLCDAKGNWMADYVRLRFYASKPGAAV